MLPTFIPCHSERSFLPPFAGGNAVEESLISPRSQTLFGNALGSETLFRDGAELCVNGRQQKRSKRRGGGGWRNCRNNGVRKQSLGTRTERSVILRLRSGLKAD